jgi:hypothetical protein
MCGKRAYRAKKARELLDLSWQPDEGPTCGVTSRSPKPVPGMAHDKLESHNTTTSNSPPVVMTQSTLDSPFLATHSATLL